jgi:glycosyltransferase involved in cell wall biosynthesis
VDIRENSSERNEILMERIHFVCITQNRVENLRRNLPEILPFVDSAVIIDGGSTDETQEYLESLAPKVKRVYRKWDDSFCNQYNEYLKHISDGWILICDDDELPSREMLESLRLVLEASEGGNKYSCVRYRAVSEDPDSGWRSEPTNYYREMFFRWTARLKYVRDPHQSLKGYYNGKMINRDEVYYHYKNQHQNFYNGCRNYWIAGVWLTEHSQDGVRGPDWNELKQVVLECYPDVKVFRDLNALMEEGNIHPRLKEWLRKWKDHPDKRYFELRLWHEYYFEFLHPEEDNVESS